jgi:hypothetical protein
MRRLAEPRAPDPASIASRSPPKVFHEKRRSGIIVKKRVAQRRAVGRPRIVRARIGEVEGCIDVDLSVERLVERLFQTSNHDAVLEKSDSLPPWAGDDSDPAASVVRLTAPAELKRTGKEMKFIVEGDTNVRTADPSLTRLIVRAHRLMRRLAENPASTLEDIASPENIGGPYAARLIRLNHLAPDIVAAILDGKQPADLTANRLMADTRLPLDWRAQRAVLGFATP